MPLVEFYSAVAQLSFTLLGLWVVALELRPDDLLDTSTLRRTVRVVSLGFLVPGVISLGSLLAVESLVMWRVAFALGGVAGALATARVATARDSVAGPVPASLWWFATVLYALLVPVAIARPTVELGATVLTPLTIEGSLITVQLLVNAIAAWRVFAMPRDV